MNLIKLRYIVFLFVFISQPVFSDNQSDSDALFNWAESQYPELFSPTNQSSQEFDVWYFRYYPNTANYVGVNSDGEVYVQGQNFPELFHVGALQALLTQFGIVSGSDSDAGSCDIFPGEMIAGCLQGSEVDFEKAKNYCTQLGGSWSTNDCRASAVVKCAQTSASGYTYIEHFYDDGWTEFNASFGVMLDYKGDTEKACIKNGGSLVQ